MRVIAGTAKGRALKSVPGEGTRPITDRAKEALFGILQHDVPGARFLDLFAGTGAVGIEALSRGAAHATFLDINRRAIATVSENLEATGFQDRAEVLREDALAYLARESPVPFDMIYVAPPQYQGIWGRAVGLIDANVGLLAPNGLVVAQIHPKEDESLPLEHLRRIDERQYGGVQLIFYAVSPGPEEV